MIGYNPDAYGQHNVEDSASDGVLEIAPRPHLKHENKHEQPKEEGNKIEKEPERFYIKCLNPYEIKNGAQDNAGDGYDNPHHRLFHQAWRFAEGPESNR